MELNHLKYFYTVARERGFSQASKTLRIQQPAISKTVKLLETSLGVVLFERHKKGVTLTKTGREVFDLCHEIFGRVDDIAQIALSENTECRGPLPFGASDTIAAHFLPAIITRYSIAHPHVNLSIFTGTSAAISEELREGRAEFGLFFTQADDPSLESTPLCPVKFHLVAATSKSPIPDTFISSRAIDYPKSRSFPAMEMLKKRGMSPEVRIASNNLECHRQLVLEGAGYAVLPAFMIEGDVRARKLKILHPERKFTYPLRVVTRKGKVLSRNATVFLEEFRQTVQR